LKVLYWAGCLTRERYAKNIKVHVKLLEKLDCSVDILGKEGCCGILLLHYGDMVSFKKNASKTAQQLREYKPDIVVTSCAGCFRAFVEYRNMGLKLPKIQHLTQTIAENLDQLTFTKAEDIVAWHDPCELGRIAGEYEAPRKVLSATAKLVEPLTTREDAFCCGAGGGMVNIAPELSTKVSEVRLKRDIEPTKAEKVVTSCPACLIAIGVAARRRKRVTNRMIEVIDFGSYVLSRLR